MKVKQLFHQAVRGTDMFRALVDLYGVRRAIKEVNKVYMNKLDNTATCRKTRLNKTCDLCTWNVSPQGLDFWLEVSHKRAVNRAYGRR